MSSMKHNSVWSVLTHELQSEMATSSERKTKSNLAPKTITKANKNFKTKT